MAKIHVDRLAKNYKIPPGGWTGAPYRELIKQIIANNSQNIQNKVVRMSKDHWDKALKKIEKKEKRFIMPDVSSTLPQRAVYIRKAAEKGNLIGDTMRDALTKNLKDALNKFTPKTNEPTYLRRRGEKAGTINPKVIKDFEKNIRATFENYVKKDKILGVPSNVRTIAVTEVRSSVNEIKGQYVHQLLQKNPDLESVKLWIHNRSMSVEPRRGHQEVAVSSQKVPLKFNQKFR